MTREPRDPVLRRLERDAAIVLVLATGLGWLLQPGWDLPLGVLGGGALAGVSYYAIRGSLEEVLSPDRSGAAGRRRLRHLLIALGRYALLGLLAYVMIARLRLHPAGLLMGASSVVVAAAFEAVRMLTRPRIHRSASSRDRSP